MQGNNSGEALREQLEALINNEALPKTYIREIAKLACEHSPMDLAYAVSYLPAHLRPVVYDHLPDRDSKVTFVVHADQETRLELFRHLGDGELGRLLNRMPAQEAVRWAEELPERRLCRLMEQIDVRKANRIRELKECDPHSAARLMNAEFFAFSSEITLAEVVTQISEHPHIDCLDGIFIVDAKGVLQGIVPARNLLINDSKIPLRQVMRPVLHWVHPEATRGEVIELVEHYRLSSLPVINRDNVLVGVISHEAIVEVMEDVADETMAHIAGAGDLCPSRDPVWRRVLMRSPWLCATLLVGLVNGSIMSSFQSGRGGLFTFVLFFVPLVTGLSGNIGLQCSTVLVRGLAMGSVLPGSRKEMVWKELCSGLCTGTIFAVSCGIAIGILHWFLGHGSLGSSAESWVIGSVVSLGVLSGCLVGTLLGVTAPFFFSKIGVDPAISAGPIVTACNDFLSLAIYFLVVWGVGHFLLS